MKYFSDISLFADIISRSSDISGSSCTLCIVIIRLALENSRSTDAELHNVDRTSRATRAIPFVSIEFNFSSQNCNNEHDSLKNDLLDESSSNKNPESILVV